MPLWGKLSGVAFLDAGNAWPNSWDFNFNDLRFAVGPGLRYATPIGPIRFDIGYQLTPIEGLLVNGEPESERALPRVRFHFSIGQSF
jgi:outer membrane translocation and assembly module TamA